MRFDPPHDPPRKGKTNGISENTLKQKGPGLTRTDAEDVFSVSSVSEQKQQATTGSQQSNQLAPLEEEDPITKGYFLRPTVTKFESLDGLSDELMRGISSLGYELPSPVQRHGIVPVMENSTDLLIQAPAGQGKTATYGIGSLHVCEQQQQQQQQQESAPFENGPCVIVIEPTTDLANQTHSELQKIGRFTDIKVVLCVGGVDVKENVAALRPRSKRVWTQGGGSEMVAPQFPGIIVGTLGRIISLISYGHLKTDDVRLLVLDEADQLLESEHDTTVQQTMEIVSKLSRDQCKFALFSATLTTDTLTMCENVLRHPGVHRSRDIGNIVSKSVDLYHINVDGYDRQGRDDVMRHLLDSIRGWGSIIIFCNRTEDARWLEKETLKEYDVTTNLVAFRNGEHNVFLATDRHARGIDIPTLGVVINMEMPLNREFFVHRVGRAGRGNKRGIAITLADARQISLLRDIENQYSCTCKELPANVLSNGMGQNGPPENRRKECAASAKSELFGQHASQESKPTSPLFTIPTLSSSSLRTGRPSSMRPGGGRFSNTKVHTMRIDAPAARKTVTPAPSSIVAPIQVQTEKNSREAVVTQEWSTALQEIVAVFQSGRYRQKSKGCLAKWISIGLKCVGPNRMLLDVQKAIVRDGCNNQIGVFCEKIIQDHGAGTGLKFLAPFVKAVPIDAQFQWINLIRDELACAQWPKIEFKGKSNKHALDVVLATLWKDVFDQEDEILLAWEKRQGLWTAAKFLHFLKEDEEEDDEEEEEEDDDDDKEAENLQTNNADHTMLEFVTKENTELKQQMAQLREQMSLLLRRESTSSSFGSSCPSTPSSSSSCSTAVGSDCSTEMEFTIGAFSESELHLVESTSSAVTKSYRTPTMRDLSAVASTTESESIGPASVKSYAATVSSAGDLNDNGGSQDDWTTSRKKKRKKPEATNNRGELQIGDQLSVQVNGSANFGTFVYWKGKKGTRVNGMVHVTNYSRNQTTKFAKGSTVTCWFLGYKNGDKSKARLTMMNPHSENVGY